jgi:hypothetical protein
MNSNVAVLWVVAPCFLICRLKVLEAVCCVPYPESSSTPMVPICHCTTSHPCNPDFTVLCLFSIDSSFISRFFALNIVYNIEYYNNRELQNAKDVQGRDHHVLQGQ